MGRVSGEEIEPHRRWVLRLRMATRKWRTWMAQRCPSPAARFVLPPEARPMRCLLNWKKVACGAFFGHRLRFRRQKAWFLPAAVARSYARAVLLHG